MSTQVTGTKRRSRLSAALVALTLAVGVFVLATQARSIWSTRTGSQVGPAPAHIAVSANPGLPASSHIAVGCRRPKYGCEHGRRTSSHVPCRRPKYGCERSGSTTATRP